MKKTFGKFRLLLAACLVFQAFNVTAQITILSEELSNSETRAQISRSNAQAKAKLDAEYLQLHPAEATNALSPHQLELLDIANNRAAKSKYFSSSHSPQELEEFTNVVRHFLTNAAAQSSYFYHVHGMTESEYMSNTARNWKPAKPWPEPSQRKAIFEHCAEVLRSAVDTNQIELVCSNMNVNFPAIREFQNQLAKDGPITITYVTNAIVMAHFRNFSLLAISNLDEFASLLSNPDLKSYVGAGYEATLSNPTNYFLFGFWPNNLVRTIEKRTADAQHVIMEASFSENGKLGEFCVISPPASIAFDAEGKLISYNGRDNNMAIELRPDETGKLELRGFLINK